MYRSRVRFQPRLHGTFDGPVHVLGAWKEPFSRVVPLIAVLVNRELPVGWVSRIRQAHHVPRLPISQSVQVEVAALVASHIITIWISDHPGIELADRFIGQLLYFVCDRLSAHIRPPLLSRRATTRLPD